MRIGQLVVDALVDESKLLQTLQTTTNQTDQTDQTDTNDLAVLGLPDVVQQSTYLLKYYVNDKQHGIRQAVFNHGVPSLDVLLASAHYLGLEKCMHAIAECCAEISKFCSNIQLDVQVAKRVFDSPMVPAVTLDWPGMESLVKICQVMPSILRLNMTGLFFNKLVGKIDTLYCSQYDYRPIVMLSRADDNWTIHRSAFDGLVDRHAYKFVCTNNNNSVTTKLVKLEMHQTKSSDWSDCLDVVDSTVMSGSVRNRLLVSSDQQHILWTCVSDNLDLARIYHHATGRLVLRLPGISKASWLGPARLAVWTTNSTAWHCIDLGGKTLFSMPGSHAAGTDTTVLSTSQLDVQDQTMTAFWVQQYSNDHMNHINTWHVVVKNDWQVLCPETLMNDTFICYNNTAHIHRLATLNNMRVTFGPVLTQLEHMRGSAKHVWTNPSISTSKP